MNENYICCGDCFEVLAKKNTRSAKWWMDMCKLKMEFSEIRGNGLFVIEDSDFEEITLIEKLKLISTCDCKDGVIIKVNGPKKDEDGLIFCGDLCSND